MALDIWYLGPVGSWKRSKNQLAKEHKLNKIEVENVHHIHTTYIHGYVIDDWKFRECVGA
jgi:hypothetical protein